MEEGDIFGIAELVETENLNKERICNTKAAKPSELLKCETARFVDIMDLFTNEKNNILELAK